MWVKKQSQKFRTPNHSKEFLRKPLILKLLGNIKNKKILEFGCGSGYWTRLLSQKGAKCVGIDNAIEQIKLAKLEEEKRPRGTVYFQEDITHLKSIKSNQFDMVFIEYVLLEIPTKRLLEKVFKEAYRVLIKGGILFISDMHPFDPIMHSRFKLPKDFNYFKSGSKMIAYGKQVDGSMMQFEDYHWTLEDYLSAITQAGFVVNLLKEPVPSEKLIEKHPYFKYREFLPKDIILQCKK